jgi:hypothetical protein
VPVGTEVQGVRRMVVSFCMWQQIGGVGGLGISGRRQKGPASVYLKYVDFGGGGGPRSSHSVCSCAGTAALRMVNND